MLQYLNMVWISAGAAGRSTFDFAVNMLLGFGMLQARQWDLAEAAVGSMLLPRWKPRVPLKTEELHAEAQRLTALAANRGRRELRRRAAPAPGACAVDEQDWLDEELEAEKPRRPAGRRKSGAVEPAAGAGAGAASSTSSGSAAAGSEMEPVSPGPALSQSADQAEAAESVSGGGKKRRKPDVQSTADAELEPEPEPEPERPHDVSDQGKGASAASAASAGSMSAAAAGSAAKRRPAVTFADQLER